MKTGEKTYFDLKPTLNLHKNWVFFSSKKQRKIKKRKNAILVEIYL